MIKIVPDVVAPAVVTGIDIATLELAADWNEYASYIVAGGAYLVAGLGLVRGNAGDFIRNMGIAALPLAARNIYARVKQPVASRASSRLALRRTSANPGGNAGRVERSYQPEFEGVAPHAF